MRTVEGRVPFRGYETWYRVVGADTSDRLPLVCLHGGPGSTHHYFEPLEQLAADGRRVVLYDQLGCGGSSRPEDDGIWSLELFLEELDALRAALGLERIHLLGTSWGGMLALEHVLARPDGVAGLVFLDPLRRGAVGGGGRGAARRAATGAGCAPRRRRPRRSRFAEAESAFDRRFFHRLDPPHPAVVRGLAAKSRRPYEAMWGPNEWTPTGRLAGWSVCGRLGEIRSPSLVLSGRHDLCTPPVAARLVDGIAGAEQVVFDAVLAHTRRRGERAVSPRRRRLPRAGRAAGLDSGA